MGARRTLLAAVGVTLLALGGLENNAYGALAFTPAPGSPIEVERGSVQLFAGDFDGDGLADVAGRGPCVTPGCSQHQFSVLLNTGGGRLQPSSTTWFTPAGQRYDDVVSRDLTGDGVSDLATTASGSLLLFRGAGDGTLAAPQTLAQNTGVRRLRSDDLNVDGRPDLVYQEAGGNLWTLLGGPGGTFAAPVSRTFPGGTFALGDLTDDGLIDAAGLGTYPASGELAVVVAEGRPDGGFGTPIFHGVGGQGGGGTGGYWAFVADLTGDSRTDLAVAEHLLPRAPAGGFEPLSRIPEVGLGAADMNRDGNLDVIHDRGILLGSGGGRFPTVAGYPDGTAGLPTIADFDADGDLDVATIRSSVVPPQVWVLLAENRDDITPPVITINTPRDQASYGKGTTIRADYVCDDDSGQAVPICSGNVPPGERIDTANPGPKTFRVDARDAAGNITSREVTYFVVNTTTQNQLPVARLGASPNPVVAGNVVNFDGDASSDPDGSIARYEWDLNGDDVYELDTGALSTTSRSYGRPGTIPIKLRVTDNSGESSVASLALEVRPDPNPPTTPGDPAPPPGGGGGGGGTAPGEPQVQPRVSINGGLPFTSRRNVALTINPPPGTVRVRISNDGGFAGPVTREFDVRPNGVYPWELERDVAGQRAQRTVYVIFVDAAGNEFDRSTDDITLDERAPRASFTVARARASAFGPLGPISVAPSASRQVTLRVVARENLSGVAGAQLTMNKRKPGPPRAIDGLPANRASGVFKGRVKVNRPRRRDLYGRVLDGAGNPSRWVRIELGARR